jgi:hypothetical protein
MLLESATSSALAPATLAEAEIAQVSWTTSALAAATATEAVIAAVIAPDGVEANPS